MAGRDPDEPHRASTALELYFDLCFVVAVAQASTRLHHAPAEGETWHALVSYLAVFFDAATTRLAYPVAGLLIGAARFLPAPVVVIAALLVGLVVLTTAGRLARRERPA